MTKMVDLDGIERFNIFNFEAWSLEQRVEFLEMVVEMQVKQLLKWIDPRFSTSANVVNRRLRGPLTQQNNLQLLKQSQSWQTQEFRLNLEKIEQQIFGNLSELRDLES